MTALIIDATRPPEWWTADHADRAATMLSAALAEAGYPVNAEPDVIGDVNFDSVPGAIACRARSLVYLRMGVDFEWCPLCPDRLMSRASHERVHPVHAAHIQQPGTPS